jgi:hypothetical protein
VPLVTVGEVGAEEEEEAERGMEEAEEEVVALMSSPSAIARRAENPKSAI